MANNPTFSNVTFAGDYFDEVFGPTVLDPAGLIDNDLVTPIDQTKDSVTINEIGDTVVLKNPTAAFSDQGTTADVDEINLQTVPYEFHKQISLDNIRTSWMSGMLQNGSLNDYEYGPLVAQFVQDVYVPKLKAAQNFLVLNGKTGLDSNIGSITFSASYTGLYGHFNASSDVRKNGLSGLEGNNLTVAGISKASQAVLTLASGSNATDRLNVGDIISIRSATGGGFTAANVDVEVVAITSDTSITVDLDSSGFSGSYNASSARVRYINRTNIIDVMAQHIQRTPIAVRRKQDVKFVIPSHLAYEWQFANAAANQNGNANYYRGAYDNQFIDKQIVILDDAPANTIGSWEKERVFYGFDLSNDYSTVEVLWQGATGSKVYNLRGAMKTGTAISTKYANQITLTTPEA
jgi:hypothetical protein